MSGDVEKQKKMANLLEGLEFPATKEEILAHVNAKSQEAGNRTNEVLGAIQGNLPDGRRYASAYDIEMAAGLMRQAGEGIREEPYERASGGPASARNVSPNTPKGEDL